MKNFNSRKHVTLLTLLLIVGLCGLYMCGNVFTPTFTLAILLTPIPGLIHSALVVASIRQPEILSRAKGFGFVASSGFICMFVGIFTAYIGDEAEVLKVLPETLATAVIFASGGMLGATLYVLLINLMLPIKIDGRRAILVVIFSVICVAPIVYHGMTTHNAPMVESDVLFLEPILWWIGVSSGLIFPSRIHVK